MFWRHRSRYGSSYRRKLSRPRAAGETRIARIEWLEPRKVLTVSLNGGVLVVTGDPGRNTFEFSTRLDMSMNPTYFVTVNGVDHQYYTADVQSLSVHGQNANDTFKIDQFPPVPAVIDGAGGVDTLIGPDADTTWNIKVVNGGSVQPTTPDPSVGSFRFGNIESLTGGTGADAFIFSSGKTISSTIDGGAGVNSIDFSAYTTPLVVNLQLHSSNAIGRFTNVTSITGGSTKDTIFGPNQATVWSIPVTNTVSVAGIDFTSFENLTGGTAADTFSFNDGAIVTGAIDGGSGNNKIDLSAYTTPVTINLQTKTISGVSSATFARIQSIVGTAETMQNPIGQTDLIGPNVATTWNITASGAATVGGIAVSNVTNLTGGTKADTFVFTDDVSTPGTTASIPGTIDGREGTDLLNYSHDTSLIIVNLTTNTAPGAATIANVEGVVGNNGVSDTLIGPATASTWAITGNNVGNVNGFTFSGIENLTGGANDDTFIMKSGKIFTGNIDGGAKMVSNTLDYSTFTASVSVNLTTKTATNITGAITNITDVLGGSGNDFLTGDDQGDLLRGNGGNDTIKGGAGDDILVGGPGNDTIIGGDGRNLLFGGLGRDILSGGDGQDILFSGTTTFDDNGSTQDLLHTFWANTAVDFATRVSQLRTGTTGVTGMPLLNSTTVLNDASSDTLTGGNDLDWFFAQLSGSPKDTITDFSGGESIN